VKKKKPSLGSALASQRWAKVSAEERRAIAMKMVEAKAKKRLERLARKPNKWNGGTVPGAGPK